MSATAKAYQNRAYSTLLMSKIVLYLLSPSGNGRRTLAFRRRLQFDLLLRKGSRVRGFQDSRVMKKRFSL